jgi:hypothetical protein
MMDKEVLRQRIDIVELVGKTVDLKRDGPRFKGLCPFHADKRSLSLVVYPETQTWKCFGCSKSGDAFQWVMEAEKVDFLTALTRLQEQYGDTESGTTNTTVWNVTDVDGNLIAQHFRYDHPDGTKTYSWNGQNGLGGIKAGELPLYGVKHLFAMETAAVNSIVIVEGEKVTDALVKAGYVAVGTVTGASSCPNQEVFAPLIGFEARKYVWPDNDPAGRSHMDKVCGHLKALDIQPYVVNWVEAPDKGDAFDYIQQGGNVQTLLDTAVPWEPVRESSPLMDNVNTHVIYVRDNLAPSTERDKNVTGSVTAPTERDNLSDRVLAWVKETTGWWATEELDRDLGIIDTRDKENRRQILHRFKEQGIVEQHTKVNKQWRYVNRRLTFLDFKGASSVGVLPIKWPLGIEKYVKLFPGNIAVVAGTQNAGKTALLLDLIRQNMNQFSVYYFCSEMGKDELQDRLRMFPGMALDDWHFKALERSSDFEDVIVPDCVNIIDFLEMTDELYRVNTHLTNMSHKVGTGLAVVAIQKKEGAKFGRGQEFGLEKPKLYLSMDKGRLTIIKGKSWANPKVDPNGLTIGFKIAGGCEFQVTREWEKGNERCDGIPD